MSGLGAGIGIIGALVVGLVGGALYIAGGALYLVARGVIEGTKLIYKAHKNAVEKRREQQREALETLKGDLGRLALERHDRMVAAEKAIEAKAAAEREKLEAETLASCKRIDEAGESIEAMMKEMPSYIASCERRVDQAVQMEIDAFNAGIEVSMKASANEIAEAVDRDAAAMGIRLDGLEAEIEGRVEAHRNYARKALEESVELLGALEKSFDCARVAPASYKSLQEDVERLRAALNEGDAAAAAAAMSAGRVIRETQMLQVELEHRTTQFEQMKANLDMAAAELDAYVKASRELAGEGAPEAVAAYVDEECDAAFWSEGRLPELWKEIAALRAQIDAFGIEDIEKGRAIYIKARMKSAQLQREIYRTRNHVLGCASMGAMVEDVVGSMEEIGWEPMAWDDEGTVVVYVQEDGNTGHYVPCDDPRAHLMMRFRNDRGDIRTIVIRSDYDEETGTYVQTMLRFCDEAGTPDELEREMVDEQFHDALEERNAQAAELAPTCDGDTKGMKIRG